MSHGDSSHLEGWVSLQGLSGRFAQLGGRIKIRIKIKIGLWEGLGARGVVEAVPFLAAELEIEGGVAGLQPGGFACSDDGLDVLYQSLHQV